MCFISSIQILVPAGIKHRTFGVTATNLTVSNDGPRLQGNPGHPGPLAFFFPTDIFFHQLTKKNRKFFPPTIGPRGFFPASAVFRSCIPGNVRTFPGMAGEIFQPNFFSNRQFFFQPTKKVVPTDKILLFQRTCSNGHFFFP